jgi:hypothetical protein
VVEPEIIEQFRELMVAVDRAQNFASDEISGGSVWPFAAVAFLRLVRGAGLGGRKV